jgi:hypothetical protein
MLRSTHSVLGRCLLLYRLPRTWHDLFTASTSCLAIGLTLLFGGHFGILCLSNTGDSDLPLSCNLKVSIELHSLLELFEVIKCALDFNLANLGRVLVERDAAPHELLKQNGSIVLLFLPHVGRDGLTFVIGPS